jgi:hypothetical protein
VVAQVSPLWRWLVTDINGVGITTLDKIASDRTVQPNLNEPLQVTGTVPSDNTEIKRLHTDNLPSLAEGARQLYCFRRESETQPYYTIRASTLILQTQDAATSDDAVTRFTAWDPWQYLFYRPCYVTVGEGLGPVQPGGYTFTPGECPTMDCIISQLLYNGLQNAVGATWPGGTITGAAYNYFLDFGQFGLPPYTGTFETLADTPTTGWFLEEGISIGQAIQDICSAGYCDIWMEPIYDPLVRPGILCQLNLYREWNDSAEHTGGMGIYNWPARFAWDRPGRSLVGVDDLFDGTQRANHILFWAGQGGEAGGYQTWDIPSIDTYGEYWAQQTFPGQPGPGTDAIAKEQLVLRKKYKQTLTVNPAPERSPEPFVDYFIGDRVPIYVSNNARQSLPPDYLPPPAPQPNPLPSVYVWQRIYGIPVSIDDNGTETVRELIVGPIGAPPDVVIPGTGAAGLQQGATVAVGAAGRAIRTTIVKRTSPFAGSGGTGGTP